MPIYSYKCLTCDKEFDFFHMTKEDVASCPHLKKDETHEIVKIMGLSSFSLKGDGWYKDLYSKKDK